MRIYRVELNHTYTNVYFDFVDFGEAMGFVGQALENGHREKDDDSKIKATIEILEEQEVGLNE